MPVLSLRNSIVGNESLGLAQRLFHRVKKYPNVCEETPMIRETTLAITFAALSSLSFIACGGEEEAPPAKPAPAAAKKPAPPAPAKAKAAKAASAKVAKAAKAATNTGEAKAAGTKAPGTVPAPSGAVTPGADAAPKAAKASKASKK